MSELNWHFYLTPSPGLVDDDLDPRECGECGEIHHDNKPGDVILEA